MRLLTEPDDRDRNLFSAATCRCITLVLYARGFEAATGDTSGLTNPKKSLATNLVDKLREYAKRISTLSRMKVNLYTSLDGLT